MGKMKKYVAMFCAMLALGVAGTSCSSDEEVAQGEAGEGVIAFDITTDTKFQSRAVSLSAYENLDNYTIQLLDGEGEVYKEYQYDKLPVSLKVEAGTYQLKAFYGEDKPASTTSMYVEGLSSKVTVEAGQEEPVRLSVACKPVCAKVAVAFNEEALDKYFSDYSVTFKTAALGDDSFIWKKADTDPVYLKVNDEEAVKYTVTAKYTDTSIPDAKVEGTYTLSPQSGLTLQVAPAGDGSLGLTITFDEKTNDIEQDIEVPNEWVNQQPAND